MIQEWHKYLRIMTTYHPRADPSENPKLKAPRCLVLGSRRHAVVVCTGASTLAKHRLASRGGLKDGSEGPEPISFGEPRVGARGGP
jgi:hypothetical protein